MSERFEHPVLEDVYQALENLRAAEELVKEVKEQIHQSVLDLSEKIGDNTDLQEAVLNHLYWLERDVQVQWLYEAFQLKADINLVAKTGKLTRMCDTCHQPFDIKVTSRSDLDCHLSAFRRKAKRGYKEQCPECEEKQKAHTRQWYAEQETRRMQRLYELQTMPYRDYLQTPEWQETRKRQLKSAGFRCQVCNTYGVVLNVHHRTYERRGCEGYKDLIVLCQECHEIFHENGRLSEVEE